jgi:N-ethylmaleimide reductase
MAHSADWREVPFEIPREIPLAEIPAIVDEYRDAARNALAAGVDGVELHAANGYLIDQFLRDGTNKRGDRYGGPVENRARFLFEVLEAVSGVLGAGRVGIRLSPFGTFNDMRDSDPVSLFSHVFRELSRKSIAYVHLIEARADEGPVERAWLENPGAAPTAAIFRPFFRGVLIGAGGFNYESASQAIAKGTVDAVAFGRHFIANPDLPRRLEIGAPLNRYDRSTFYGGGPKGYVDYPALEETKPAPAPWPSKQFINHRSGQTYE